MTLPARTDRPAPLRLVGGERPRPASPAAWTWLFGSLSLSAGHGLFLLTALTRLEKIPSAREIGEPFQLAVVAWFALAPFLALLVALFRARLARLAGSLQWSLALGSALATLVAFTVYLRAVALAG